MSENITDKNSLDMFVDYKEIPGALFCRWIDRQGYAFKIPRHQYRKKLLDKFPEGGLGTFRGKACIYILFGEPSTEEGDGEEEKEETEGRAYIGASSAIDTRLGTHAFSSKSWDWRNVIIFCHNDHIFGKDELLYIEEQLIIQSQKIERFDILNSKRNAPTCNVRDKYENAADMFVQSIQLLCHALGYTLFEPMSSGRESQQPMSANPSPQDSDDDMPIFTTRSSGEYRATGKMTGDGKTFVVFADSTISRTEASTIRASARAKREELQSSEVIKNFTFEEDYVFKSASAAAGVICGHNASANAVWEGLKAFRSGGADDQ